MPEITTGDGCRLAYRWDGPSAGRPLLLSNSLGTSMAMWEPQLASLSTRYRVLRYDNRGHGASDAPSGAYSMDRLGRDVIELLDALDLSRVAFCGLSLGGMVGQWMGVRAPERLDRLIIANSSPLMGPPSSWDHRIELVRSGGMAALVQATMTRWFTPGFIASRPDATAPVQSMLLATGRDGYAGCCAAIRDMDMRRLLGLIGRPTLVIGGTQDPATPPDHARLLADGIPDASLAMLEAAHLSNVERAEEFTRVVAAFLG